MTFQTPPSENGLREFAMRFTSTPRGVNLARHLHEWGHAYATEPHDTATLIVAELAANAVRHGNVPGRDFHLSVSATPTTIRIEVTDTRIGRRPPVGDHQPPPPQAESGRGLLLVASLAARWAITGRRGGGPGKTIWAEVGTEGAGPP